MKEPLNEKVSIVLSILNEHGYTVPKTGLSVTGTKRAMVVYLINAWRKKQHIPTRMYEANLANYLNKATAEPIHFRKELINAFGLDDIGCNESLWDYATPTMKEIVDHALSGGVLAQVLNYPIDAGLLELYHPIPKGIRFPEEHADIARLFRYPEIVVRAGQPIETRTTMPFDGFLKVIAFENGEFIGMNSYLGISSSRIDAGSHTLRPIETSPHVAKTILLAFATTKRFNTGWPDHHGKDARLDHTSLLRLAQPFFEIEGTQRSSCVRSFVTSISTPMGESA